MLGTIQLGGHTIEIELVDSLLDDNGNVLYGHYREREGKILLSKQAGSLLGQTLVHEITHAIDTVFNNGQLSEETVDALAQGFYQLLKGRDVYNFLKDDIEETTE